MKPLFRWTIGPVQPAGFECLKMSIDSWTHLYDADVLVCHNCEPENLAYIPQDWLYDQRQKWDIEPMGVAWKLYPPRIAPERHEILIDNDIILEERVEEIDRFLKSDCTLLLEDVTRNYGRFDKHVPPGHQINSGIYGMPPSFDFDKYVKFYVGSGWETNARGEYSESKTFDEQGLVATALLSYPSYVTIPNTSIVSCEREFVKAKGMHFIGVNRKRHHRPFQLYKSSRIKLYL